jgi:hypothetical protein
MGCIILAGRVRFRYESPRDIEGGFTVYAEENDAD